MSSKSTYAMAEAPPGEQYNAIEPAAHKSSIEWSDLVGFRRRETAPVAQTKTPQPMERAADAIVIVGKGASIVGEITNCSQVEIAGALEGKVIAEAVIVRAGGCLKGHVCSERAEVHGTIEGQVQVDDHLDIRSTGQVSGELAYGKLSVASGGRLAGTIEIVAEHHVPEIAAEHHEAFLTAETIPADGNGEA